MPKDTHFVRRYLIVIFNAFIVRRSFGLGALIPAADLENSLIRTRRSLLPLVVLPFTAGGFCS